MMIRSCIDRSRPPLRSGVLVATVAVGMFGAFGALAQTPLPLRICAIDDRSGGAADAGIESLNGLMMVIDAANAAGGINGQKIDVVQYDGKTDAQLTSSLAVRCAEDDRGLLLIGGSPSGPAAAMVPVASQFGIPYYVLNAAVDSLTDDAVWHYRFGPKNGQDVAALSATFRDLGITRVGLINNALPFGTDGAHATAQALRESGIEVVSQQTYDVAATDVTPQVMNVKLAEPQVIVVWGYPADGARVARTIKQLGITTPVVMPRIAFMPAFRNIAGEDADGLLSTTSVDMSRPEVAKIFEDYNARFPPIAPSPSVLQGYDAATLALKTFADSEVQKAIAAGDLAAARQAIKDATERHGKFQGMQGRKGVPYILGPGEHHGPPDESFLVFTEVANKGRNLVVPDLSRYKPAN